MKNCKNCIRMKVFTDRKGILCKRDYPLGPLHMFSKPVARCPFHKANKEPEK